MGHVSTTFIRIETTRLEETTKIDRGMDELVGAARPAGLHCRSGIPPRWRVNTDRHEGSSSRIVRSLDSLQILGSLRCSTRYPTSARMSGERAQCWGPSSALELWSDSSWSTLA